jgi:thiol-disulfide isomerase/thioredoxin
LTPNFRHRAGSTVALLLLAATMTGSPCFAAESVLRPWPGKTATPALALVALDGSAVKLESLRGKVVVVNFWASWCAPCIEELPVLNDLADSGAGADKVVVLGVNYKESAAIIARFAAEHPFRFTVLRDSTGDTFKQWAGGVMPTTILIDRSGRARWRIVGELDKDHRAFKQAVQQLIASP